MKKFIATLFVTFICISVQAQNVGIGTITPTDQLHTTGTVRLQNYNGKTTRLLQIDSSGRLVATAAGSVFSNSNALAISDNGCVTGTGISSSIIVSGQPNIPVQSSKIAVKVNITHTFVGDLKIYLFPPGTDVITLADGNGNSGDNFTNTIFSDAASTSINDGSAPFTGQYKPKGGVASCNITNTSVNTFSSIGMGSIIPNGTWTLRVFDAAGSDVGVLNNWSISFTGSESITSFDENNYIPKLVDGNFTASTIFQATGTNNIGIGTNSPTAKLEVNGTVKITDGSQAAKKVLTSDANGNASWASAAYGNTERFNFKISSFSTNPIVLTSIYNYGTATTNYTGGAENFSIVISKSGLYHLDIGAYQYAGADYSPSSINARSLEVNYVVAGNAMYGFAPFIKTSSTFSNSSYDKSYEVYINAPATLNFNLLKLPNVLNYFLVVTGHLISE